MVKKRKIIGRNRKFNRDAAFNRKAKIELMVADMKIREAFPDPEARAAYIEALIHGLETEPIQEIN